MFQRSEPRFHGFPGPSLESPSLGTYDYGMTRSTVSSRIREEWPGIVAAAIRSGLRPSLESAAVASLPSGPLRLGGSSAKIRKGEAESAVLTRVVYLAPAGEAASDWRLMCPGSTPGCRAACLVSSGRMGMSASRRARLWKTALYLGAPDLFWGLIIINLQSVAVEAARLGLGPAFRVNGTSDIEIPRVVSAAARRLGVSLYGYSKLPSRALSDADTAYSFDGTEASWAHAERVLDAGGRVSAVVDLPKGEDLPDTFRGRPAIDGDLTDAVYTRPRGVVLLLRLKGTRKAKTAARRRGFVTAVGAFA